MMPDSGRDRREELGSERENMSLLDNGVSPLATHIGHINALIYAPSGNGKTTAASTTPGKIAYLASEPQGALAVKSNMIERGRDPDSIKIFEITEKVIDGKKVGARKFLDMMLDELEHDPKDFTAVVLDSITDVQNTLVTAMKKSKGGLMKPLNQQEWGYIIDSTRNLCIRLRNLKLHTVVIALANETQDDEQKVVYRPNLVGKKLPQDIPQYFNIVCFMDKEWERGAKEEKFIARMRSSSSRIYTKGHRALNSEEVPDVSVWMDKLSAYWSRHGQEALPEDAEVTKTEPKVSEEDARLKARLEDPKTIELFAELEKYEEVDDARKRRAAKKFRSDEKLWQVIDGMIEKAKKKAEKKGGSK
jgi:hypothetical protein